METADGIIKWKEDKKRTECDGEAKTNYEKVDYKKHMKMSMKTMRE